MATKKDYWLVAIIGVAVGLLVQPILANTIHNLENVSGLSSMVIRLGALIFFALLAPIALLIASWIGKKLPVIYQFAKFAAVGSLNSSIDLGILNLQTLLWGGDPRFLSTSLFFIFKSVSFLAATTNSFFWNKMWTFGDREHTTSGTLVKFYVITAITYALNTGVATGLKVIGPMGGVPANVWVNVLAPVCGILVALFANFFSYKFLVFKEEN